MKGKKGEKNLQSKMLPLCSRLWNHLKKEKNREKSRVVRSTDSRGFYLCTTN